MSKQRIPSAHWWQTVSRLRPLAAEYIARAVNGLRQGRNYTANIVRLGRVAARRHELAAALRVVQEWEAL